MLQVKSGIVYEGIFHTWNVENNKELHVVLSYAKIVKDPNSKPSDRQAAAERPVKRLVIHDKDLVQIVAKDVRMNPEDLGPVDRGIDGFETDSAISRGRGG